jgi:hypothetical protein
MKLTTDSYQYHLDQEHQRHIQQAVEQHRLTVIAHNRTSRSPQPFVPFRTHRAILWVVGMLALIGFMMVGMLAREQHSALNTGSSQSSHADEATFRLSQDSVRNTIPARVASSHLPVHDLQMALHATLQRTLARLRPNRAMLLRTERTLLFAKPAQPLAYSELG